MLRTALTGIRRLAECSTVVHGSYIATVIARRPLTVPVQCSGSLVKSCENAFSPAVSRLAICARQGTFLQQPLTRTVTKFSLKKGKRKSVKAVLKRFFRLHWGIWIRTKAGRHKRMWTKSSNRRRRLRQHVFCNATQSTLLDKMVTKYWKRPKYYVDDPYAPYHTREEFLYTRRKPKVY
ncbi:39S ribosomal protein L35, mitochondrial [Schistocerca cancellata]|uniref:39S ribosomal protein L35, mitochondrial n=1 Tax=Schistocerca cancellata TaxID=274614 RepID=UPI002117EE8A|nr:39S ribosomal protein L35, mitochondrial [Schistocerca cancellata]